MKEEHRLKMPCEECDKYTIWKYRWPESIDNTYVCTGCYNRLRPEKESLAIGIFIPTIDGPYQPGEYRPWNCMEGHGKSVYYKGHEITIVESTPDKAKLGAFGWFTWKELLEDRGIATDGGHCGVQIKEPS